MAVAAIQRGGNPLPVAPEPIIIKENSTLMKVLSCIPLVGILPIYIQEKSLAVQIKLSNNVPHLVELINVKNQYKAMTIVRNLLNIALVISGFALAILSKVALVLCVGIFVLNIMENIYKLSENKSTIHLVQARGLAPNLVIY